MNESVLALEDYRSRVQDACKAFPGSVVAQWNADRCLPATAVATLAEAGLFRDRWAQGAQAGLPYLVTLTQELWRCDSGLALAAMAQSEAFIGALSRLASTPVQRRLLGSALSGRAVGCFAATESQGGSSLSDIQASATRVRGGWQLRGTKRYISNIGSASHALVTARTAAPDAHDHLGVSLFVVPLAADGVVIDGFFDTAGLRSCDVGQVSLDVILPEDCLLGGEGLGLLYASHLLQFERLAICAQLHVAAEQALRLATAYARQRTVGGAPLIDKQVIGHRLAHAQAELWNLQSRLDALVTKAAQQPGMPAHEIAALKLTSGLTVTSIIDTCMQVFGARGNTGAYPLTGLQRDCRIARIGGGTDEVLADVITALLNRPDPDAENQLQAAAQADTPVPRKPRQQVTDSAGCGQKT